MASPAPMPRALARLSFAHLLRTALRPAATAAAPYQQLLLLRRAYASSPSKPPADGKPLVLEKPDKFRPPSHPARLPASRKKPQYAYGPRLTPDELAAQKRKKYPNMMPPEGSFMHWFLTNRMLHVYISLAVLFSLAFYTFLVNFLTTTPYRDLLPARADLLAHPLRSLHQFLSVYRMHAEHVSAETAERRKRKVEDVDKRAEYRRAHGLEDEDGSGGVLKGWFGGEERAKEEKVEGGDVAVDAQSPVAPEEQEGFRDFEGKPVQRRPVKKWLGIW